MLYTASCTLMTSLVTNVQSLTSPWPISTRYASIAQTIAIEEDVSYSRRLPVQRVMALCNMAVGGRIGFSTGDPLRLLEDIQLLKPTFVATVPRVLNRIYQAAMVAATAPGLKGALFNKATQVKLMKLRATGQRTHAFWDRLVFSKVGSLLL